MVWLCTYQSSCIYHYCVRPASTGIYVIVVVGMIDFGAGIMGADYGIAMSDATSVVIFQRRGKYGGDCGLPTNPQLSKK